MAGLPQPLPVLMPPLLLLVVASLAGVRGNLESSAASQPETMDETVVVGGTVKLSCTVEEPDNSSLQWSNPQQQTLYFGEKRGVPQKPEIIGYDGPFKENQKVTLTCKTFGSKPAAQLSWYKGPEKLEGAKSEVSEDANKKTFTVRSQIEFLVSQKDNGVEIVCAVEPQSHLNGDSSTSLKIEVLYSPTARIDAYPQIPREGEKLRLQCDGSGNPTPHTYAWEKEDGELPPQTKEEENSLVFLFLNRSDSGSYLCKASNTLGTFVAKYRLEVNAVLSPSSPDPSPVPSTSTIDHAVIGCVVAVIVFLLLCLIIVLGRYLIRHKGTYLTHEAKGADDAPDADTAIINAEASQAGGDDKKEYFI
ncbi:cell adhesion molecule 3 isoform X3 [Rhinatrema bivittatum]|uniref:cell adhesion molecule 3 isoform X3 n=1 Tax=Rhinatrema bivittatum TaxID=194408 RepID=UPI00112C20C9|nr:cell adhesion molecule 3 isoform X3 [Rhinatrema bivittatum]